jgi:hypothetical protein
MAEIDGRIMNSAEPKNVEFPLGGEIPDDLGKLYQAGGPTPWSHHLRQVFGLPPFGPVPSANLLVSPENGFSGGHRPKK